MEEKAALSSLEEAISSVETDTALLDSIETETQDFEQEDQAVKKTSIDNIVDFSSAGQVQQLEIQEALVCEKVSERKFTHKITWKDVYENRDP